MHTEKKTPRTEKKRTPRISDISGSPSDGVSSSVAGSSSDLAGSYDYGKKKIDKNHCGSIDICPDLLFATLAAALAGAFLALFTAITMAGRKRRRRRDVRDGLRPVPWFDAAMDYFWLGG